MERENQGTPTVLVIGIMVYLAAVLGIGGWITMDEWHYGVPLMFTGVVGAFFSIYQKGRMTIVSALLGLILNLVLLFGLAAEDIFMAIQNGEIPNLHYGLPLVAGLFGYLLGQINQLMQTDEQAYNGAHSDNVVMMRPLMPNDKDIAQLESRISAAVAKGVADGVTQGLRSVLQPSATHADRKSA